MIIDSLQAIGRYRGISAGLDILIDWLEHNNPAELPVGSNQIAGDRVFANVMDATTRPATDALYEAHHRYMDVHVDITGVESFKTCLSAVEPAGPFDEETDGGLFAPHAEEDALEGILGPGRFVVFLPDEQHMPTLVPAGAEPAPVHKICFKVLADAYWNEGA